MSRLLERLRDALRPDYEVERELASGGMGVVFIARDVVLDRPVAVKVIRPELATARTREQFLREARLLAKLNHPNVVPVHRAGEADGLLYYVMDHVRGETLALRIANGPLPPRTVVKIGRDVLDALEALHELGIVHRDVKPENIFLVGNRALLADFGLAATVAPERPDTGAPNRPPGTPGYIAPEQRTSGAVTPQTDMYAVGVTLTEALTGRRWDEYDAERDTDWIRVPRRYQRLLRRAVQLDPNDRWPDARTFRHALWRTRRRAVRALVGGVAVAGAVTGALAAVLFWPTPGPPQSDVALLPFSVRGNLDAEWGVDLARLAEASLSPLHYVPINQAVAASPGPVADTAALLRQLNADALVTGFVEPVGDDSLHVTVVVTPRAGSSAAAPVLVSRNEVQFVGCALASQIVYLAAPRQDDFACNRALWGGTSAEAVTQWLAGERAFFRQDWAGAEARYTEALAIDPGFALAKWRRIIARNWQRTGPGIDLDRFYREEADRLPDVDHLLLDAMRTPLGPERYAKFEQATARFPHHTYPWLLFGDDLLHRGPLVGYAQDSAARVLSVATSVDSSLSPAYMQLAWALIKLGRREGAAAAVTRLLAVADRQAVVPPVFFLLVYYERFAPDSALPLRAELLGGGRWGPITQEFLEKGLRWGLSFNVPRTQLEIADAILEMQDAPAAARTEAFVARGTALIRLGRIHDGMTAFDSVATRSGDPEWRLVRAQWPVFLTALGMVRADSAELARARRTLAGMASPDAPADRTDLPSRATWTLAIDALMRDDSAAFARRRTRLGEPDDARYVPLARMADAWRAGRSGGRDEALRLSEPLVGLVAGDVPDPFLRTALYVMRGEWEALGEEDSTPASWLWYWHSDAVGWLGGALQAAEVDWAFGTLAEYLAAAHAARNGRVRRACDGFAAVTDWWRDAGADLRAPAEQAQAFLGERCPA